jgi:hypothetical protein
MYRKILVFYLFIYLICFHSFADANDVGIHVYFSQHKLVVQVCRVN